MDPFSRGLRKSAEEDQGLVNVTKKKKTFTSRRICSKLPYFADILERRDEEDDTESIKKARRFYRACVDFGMLGVLHFYLLKSQCCKTSRCCKF